MGNLRLGTAIRLGAAALALSGCSDLEAAQPVGAGGATTATSSTAASTTDVASTSSTTSTPSTSTSTSATSAGSGGGSSSTSGASGSGGASGTAGGSSETGGSGGSAPDASAGGGAPDGGEAGPGSNDGGFPPGATIGSCLPAKWTTSALASAVANPPSYGADAILVSRWSTGVAQAPGQYYQVDFGGYVRLSQIVLDSTGSPGDHPRGYQVKVSADGADFSEIIGEGTQDELQHDLLTIDFAPRAVRHLRIESTASASPAWWSIHELRATCQIPGDGGLVTEMPPPDPDVCTPDDAGAPPALNRANWIATASATSTLPADVITNAIDGNETTRWSSGKMQGGDEWFKLDLGSSACFGQLSMTSPATDFPIAYAVAVSTDDAKYTVVASGNGQSSIQLSFIPHNARYVRVSQYGLAGSWWSINEISVQR